MEKVVLKLCDSQNPAQIEDILVQLLPMLCKYQKYHICFMEAFKAKFVLQLFAWLVKKLGIEKN